MTPLRIVYDGECPFAQTMSRSFDFGKAMPLN